MNTDSGAGMTKVGPDLMRIHARARQQRSKSQALLMSRPGHWERRPDEGASVPVRVLLQHQVGERLELCQRGLRRTAPAAPAVEVATAARSPMRSRAIRSTQMRQQARSSGPGCSRRSSSGTRRGEGRRRRPPPPHDRRALPPRALPDAALGDRDARHPDAAGDRAGPGPRGTPARGLQVGVTRASRRGRRSLARRAGPAARPGVAGIPGPEGPPAASSTGRVGPGARRLQVTHSRRPGRLTRRNDNFRATPRHRIETP